VALTFHGAGDPAIVRDMLATVGRAGARLTVLAIGQWLAGDPALAGMIRDGGHELGNHTWSHQTMPRLGAAQVRDEVDRAAQELTRLTGSPGRWFRPSGTPSSTAAIRAAAVDAGYGACLAYDVDPMDYADPGPDAVVARFTAAVRPGSIVSLHLGHPGTLQAMPRLLTVLHARGLAAVTVTDLLRAA
jgi:peptidoglycan/xylan/chitin deacetylase (PgdA/CDA1 family)